MSKPDRKRQKTDEQLDNQMDIDGNGVEEGAYSHSNWQTMIQKRLNAIVSIRFSQTSSFDTEGADTSEASGFVVDAKNGIILTNRHG